MLINDVGGKFEEINIGAAGANYGWPVVEHGDEEAYRGDDFQGPIHWYFHWKRPSPTPDTLINRSRRGPAARRARQANSLVWPYNLPVGNSMSGRADFAYIIGRKAANLDGSW